MSAASASPGHVRPVRAAVFDDVEPADRAVERLLAGGFRADQLSVVCSDAAKRHHFAHLHEEHPSGDHAARGALTGGAVGLVAGALVALAGVIATGDVGLFAAGSLAGAGIAGSFVGAMMTRGAEAEEADFYDQELRRGQILLVVKDRSETPRLDDAEAAMREAGAIPFQLGD